MSLDGLVVFIDAPTQFVPRATWVLDTMLAQTGRRVVVTGERGRAGEACLAYAAAPVPGVPTLPCSHEAMELFASGRPLPPGSFKRWTDARGVAGAFPADDPAAYAVPFDLVASAFVLLACWDERTSTERDRFGRLPYSASIFASNRELRIDRPEADAYVELLRTTISPRLVELGEAPLRPRGWVWERRRPAGAELAQQVPFALALTHDLDNLWRWTPRGFAATAYRSLRAARRGDIATLRQEMGDLADWLVRHLPRHSDPYWTFPQMLGGENARGVRSTFFVIARHTHQQDGTQPKTYGRRVPAALELLRRHRREIGLHGNDSDRRSEEALEHDRRLLLRAAISEVEGIRYHYLRCLYHETLPLLERAGFGYDTSLAFAEREGFRCGCSFPFRPYHLDEERPLDLVELPLALMDGTLQQPHYRGLAAEEAVQAGRDVLREVAVAGGAASILWHNNRFDRRVARGYDAVYWRLLDEAIAAGAWATSAGEIVSRWREATGAPRPRKATRTGRQAAHARHLQRAGRGEREAPGTRVLHLSVVHRPDDPRIHERECRKLVGAGYEVAYLAPGARSGFDESGILLVPLPARRRSTRFLSAVEIVAALRALRPQVVHVHDPELLTLFPALRRFVPRLVYDMHEYVPEAVAGKPYIPAAVRPAAGEATAIAQRRIAALADGVVVVTEEQLSALGSTPELRLVLPNYPHLARFRGVATVPDLAVDPRLKLIYVGSLSRSRGCTMMLDVMERLAPEDAVLYLGGTFNEPQLEAEVRQRLAAGLDDRVRLLGRVPPARLPGHLAAADVVWVPSLPSRQYRHKTIPTKLLEGMAMGLAALVSDMPGRGELVREEGCGVVVPPGVDGHLAGVRRLLADRQSLPAMGARGRLAVEGRYSWEAVSDDLVDFYAALCAGLPDRAGSGRLPEE